MAGRPSEWRGLFPVFCIVLFLLAGLLAFAFEWGPFEPERERLVLYRTGPTCHVETLIDTGLCL